MGNYHVTVCSDLPGVQLVAVSDHHIEYPTKVIPPVPYVAADCNAWLSEVDAVIIATPTDTHYAIAKACLLRGKHVLVEKPLTRCIDQAHELLDLANRQHLVLHVGYIERFNGALRALPAMTSKPYLIESHRMGPFSSRVARDSVVLDLMIHDLDLILGMVDEPIESMQVHGQKMHTDSCDVASVMLKFNNGTLAHLIASRASLIRRRSMAMHYQESFFALDFTTQDLVAQTMPGITNDHNGSVHAVKDNPLKLEVLHFVQSIQAGCYKTDQERDLAALHLTFEVERHLGLR